MSYGVNQSSWSKLFLLQNYMNIDGTTLILFFSSHTFTGSPVKQLSLKQLPFKKANSKSANFKTATL